MKKWAARFAILSYVAIIGACRFGGSSFSGNIGEREFHPEGTVFGFGDAITPAPELSGREHPRVVIALTFASLDPNVDQESKSGRDIADLAHVIEVSDWLSMWWNKRDQIVEGSQYTDVILMGGQEGRYDDSDSTATGRTDDFRLRFGFAREVLETGSSYTDYRPFGTRAIATVRLTDVNLDAGGTVAGKITLKVERIESDSANARTGSIEGEFVAPIIKERIAEKNFDTLGLYNLLEVRR